MSNKQSLVKKIVTVFLWVSFTLSFTFGASAEAIEQTHIGSCQFALSRGQEKASLTQENKVLQGYLDSYQKLSGQTPRTSGIEVEALVPENLGVEGLANHIAAFLQARYPNLKKVFEWKEIGANFLYQRRFLMLYDIGDGFKRQLILTEDLSVNPSEKTHPIELISPILRGDQDYSDFFEIANLSQQMGVIPEPNSAGVHFHNGIPEPSVGLLATMAFVQNKIETALFEFAHVSEGRRKYAEPIDPKLIEDMMNGKIADEDIPSFVSTYFGGRFGRYRALNFAALLRHGTLEDRLVNSTLNPKIISFFHGFFSRLRWAVQTKDENLISLLLEGPKTLSIEQVAVALGMEINEVKTVKELIKAEAQAFQTDSSTAKNASLKKLPRLFMQNIVVPLVRRNQAPQGWTLQNEKTKP